MAFTIFGSLLDWASNKDTNWSNANNVYNTNMANRDIARETNASNMAMNQANIEMQQKENEIARQREDNAVQRRAADLMGAGLSKTLAAGSPASANAMQAPQNTMAAQTGAPMQAYKANAYQGFETAAYHHKQNQIAEKELDVEYQKLENEQFKAEEQARHNKVSEENERSVIEENRRFHDIEAAWKSAELNQNAEFHKDSMELSWAKHDLDKQLGLSEIENKEHQNIWYDTQVKLSKNQDRRDFMRMTADLAESDARTGLYLTQKHLNREEVEYLKKESSYLGALTAERIATVKHLDAETRDTLASSYTKMYNLWLARKEGTTTSGRVVSESEATENKRGRHTELARTVLTVGGTLAGIGLGAFIKSGGASRVWNKMFGEDAQLARAAKYWGL